MECHICQLNYCLHFNEASSTLTLRSCDLEEPNSVSDLLVLRFFNSMCILPTFFSHRLSLRSHKKLLRYDLEFVRLYRHLVDDFGIFLL